MVQHDHGTNARAGTYRGKSGIAQFIALITELTDGALTTDVKEILGGDEYATVIETATGKRQGQELNLDVCTLYHVNNAGAVDEIHIMPLDCPFGISSGHDTRAHACRSVRVIFWRGDAGGGGDPERAFWAAMAEVRPLASAEVELVVSVLGLARLHQGDGFYLVAWERNEPVGHAHLALTDPPELQDVEVRLEYRRRGIASALTARAEDEARTRGFDRLCLTVSVDNAPAQALYRQCGYVDAGVAPKRVMGTIEIRSGPIEVDDTLLTWEKRLSDSAP
ncbi:MAG: GNAT family N-acetyltransferase [Acidimicrobiia bacterium]